MNVGRVYGVTTSYEPKTAIAAMFCEITASGGVLGRGSLFAERPVAEAMHAIVTRRDDNPDPTIFATRMLVVLLHALDRGVLARESLALYTAGGGEAVLRALEALR